MNCVTQRAPVIARALFRGGVRKMAACMLLVTAGAPTLVAQAGPATEAPIAAPSVSVDNRLYDALLQAYVVDGRVNYDGFARDSRFPQYLAVLNAVNPERLVEPERLAYWLNVYNAYVIQLIVTHNERTSIRNINRTFGILRLKGPWSEPLVRAAGRVLTLDDVAHRILRTEFHDPRIHFAMVNAALGSPPLRSEAYRGAMLEQQLFDQGRRFLRESPWNNTVDSARFELSVIFDAYRQDFGGTLKALGTSLGPWFEGPARQKIEAGRLFFTRREFDWSLNSTARPVTSGVSLSSSVTPSSIRRF